jgi:hypothetical protein
MKKIILSFLAAIIIFLAVYLFLNERIKPNQNVIECSFVKIVCPDTFLSICTSIYDSSMKSCINCIPDCSGHENQSKIQTNSSGLVLCPEVLLLPDFCKGGRIEPEYNEIGCVVDYRCIE